MGPTFHGMKLAPNSFASNFHVEQLAADPVPLSAGRIWLNTTEKLFKYSSIDGVGAVVTHAFASAGELSTSIASLTAALSAEVAARTAAESAEMTARVDAVNALNAALAQEVADRAAADAAEALSRQQGDATEAASRTTAIAVAAATAADATATETAARLSGDAALNTRIDNAWAELDVTQAGAGLNTDGSYTAPANTTNLGTSNSLKDAAVKLDDALTAEVATRAGQVAGLASGLANEAQSRADGDIALQTQITEWVNVQVAANASADLVEQAARIAADAAIKAEIDLTQATIGTAPDGSLIPITGTNYLNDVTTVFGGAFVLDTQVHNANVAIAAEVAGRQAADVVLDAALTSEIATRASADVAIQSELNTTQAGAGLETTGGYLALVGSNYLDTATTLKDADAKLDAALKAVSNRVTAIEDVALPGLSAQITAEVNRATAAEVTLTNDLAAAANAVTAEQTRALAAEGVLASDLSTESAARVAGDAGLQSQINAVVAASGSGAAALKTELNAKRYTYISGAPALVHTVTHNLNTQFYSANIMVKGADGVFRNDIVPVEDIDANSYRITLSYAADVKASGQSNDVLA